MSDNNTTYNVWVNPLRLFSLEGPPFRPEETELNYAELLSELGNQDADNSFESIKRRYARLTSHDADLFLVPVHDVILQKLVWPLRAAKQAFCLGNHLGCIALCGTVAEMITIFLFELAGPTINEIRMDAATQKKLFGSSFERLGQERRLDVLEAYSILPKDLIHQADQIRGTRRSYLHILSKESSKIEDDAARTYRSAVQLVKAVIGLRPVEGGMVTMTPQLAQYLEKDKEATEPERVE